MALAGEMSSFEYFMGLAVCSSSTTLACAHVGVGMSTVKPDLNLNVITPAKTSLDQLSLVQLHGQP